MLTRDSSAWEIRKILTDHGFDLPETTPKKTLLDIATSIGLAEKTNKAELDETATNEQIVAALAKKGIKVLASLDRKLLVRLAGQNGLINSGNSKISAKKKNEYGKDQHCGDELALILKEYCKGRVAEAVIEIGRANNIDVQKKYGNLNPGMQRMNLGNVLRNRIRNGYKVVIGNDIWNKEEHIPAAK